MVRKLLRDVGRLGLSSVLVSGCAPSETARPTMGDRAAAIDRKPPNIVMFVTHDLSDVAPFGALAKTGGRFSLSRSLWTDPSPSAFSTIGATQSAMLTGVHPDTLGLSPQTHDFSAIPPPGVKAFPELLREAGFYTVRIGEARHTLSPSRSTTAREFWQPGLLGAWDVAGPGVDWRREPGEPCTVSFGCGGYVEDRDSPFFVMVNVDGVSSAVDQTDRAYWRHWRPMALPGTPW